MSKPFTSDEFSPSFEDGVGVSDIKKGKTAPLYVYRSVVNADEIRSWARAQGFKSVIAPNDLHVTVIYSKVPVDWFSFGENYSGRDGKLTVSAGGPRAVERLGDKGAVVLMFASDDLRWRNRAAVEYHGASWDYDDYTPHITLTYEAGDMDLSKVEAYTGEIVLGPEMFEDIEDGWSDLIVEKVDCRIAKVDESLGLVFGWAIVNSINGEPYYDWNIDKRTRQLVPEHITEDAMLKAALPFAQGDRAANDMHKGADIGSYPFIMPLTDDIAKAYGIQCDKRGLMVAFKPDDKEMLKQFADGRRKGFSIEGQRVTISEHD